MFKSSFLFLDDRIVRESERKSAMLHFGLKRKEESFFSEKESSECLLNSDGCFPTPIVFRGKLGISAASRTGRFTIVFNGSKVRPSDLNPFQVNVKACICDHLVHSKLEYDSTPR
uniref:Uncharacterized protein n=1 Tax=Chelydra serpentina TaxID=8475 RepID=A0A8C3S4A8_CHESE